MSVDVINPINPHVFDQVYDVQEEDIDYEQIEREVVKMMHEHLMSRENTDFTLSISYCKEWMKNVKSNADQYSWRKWNITAFPAAKIGLSVIQVGVIVYSGAQMKRIEPILKGLEYTQSTVDVAKQFFDTLDTGKRTEGQAKADLSKLLFERTERESQTAEQQKADNLRKAEEAAKRRQDIEQAMAR